MTRQVPLSKIKPRSHAPRHLTWNSSRAARPPGVPPSLSTGRVPPGQRVSDAIRPGRVPRLRHRFLGRASATVDAPRRRVGGSRDGTGTRRFWCGGLLRHLGLPGSTSGRGERALVPDAGLADGSTKTGVELRVRGSDSADRSTSRLTGRLLGERWARARAGSKGHHASLGRGSVARRGGGPVWLQLHWRRLRAPDPDPHAWFARYRAPHRVPARGDPHTDAPTYPRAEPAGCRAERVRDLAADSDDLDRPAEPAGCRADCVRDLAAHDSTGIDTPAKCHCRNGHAHHLAASNSHRHCNLDNLERVAEPQRHRAIAERLHHRYHGEHADRQSERDIFGDGGVTHDGVERHLVAVAPSRLDCRRWWSVVVAAARRS